MLEKTQLTRTNRGPPRTKKSLSNGGKKGILDKIERQIIVEKSMLAGYTDTQIYNLEQNGERIGTINTITNDINEIRSRWLEMDPEWFNRARLARIEAEKALMSQLQRLNELITKLLDGEYDNSVSSNEEDGSSDATSNDSRPSKLVYAEAQLTTVISKLYDIRSDFDPEQYLDERIKESMNAKIEKAKAKAS